MGHNKMRYSATIVLNDKHFPGDLWINSRLVAVLFWLPFVKIYHILMKRCFTKQNSWVSYLAQVGWPLLAKWLSLSKIPKADQLANLASLSDLFVTRFRIKRQILVKKGNNAKKDALKTEYSLTLTQAEFGWTNVGSSFFNQSVNIRQLDKAAMSKRWLTSASLTG